MVHELSNWKKKASLLPLKFPSSVSCPTPSTESLLPQTDNPQKLCRDWGWGRGMSPGELAEQQDSCFDRINC